MLRLVSLAAIIAASPALATESAYVAKLKILATNGKFEENVIASTVKGVSQDQCELAVKVWLAEHGDSMDAAVKQLAEQGKHSAYSVECEVKP